MTVWTVVACSGDEASDAVADWRTADSAGDLQACERPQSRLADPEGELVLEELQALPCTVVAVATDVVLRGTEDGDVPNPGREVVRSGDGGFFTTEQAVGGRVLAWSSDGTFIEALGRQGDGPGEFSGMGRRGLFVGPADSLYVLDDRQRWTVFGPDRSFDRVFTGLLSGRETKAMHLTGRGQILTTGPVIQGGEGHSFHLMDLEGQPVRSFGGQPTGGRAARLSAYGGSETFWVAPPQGAPGGIVLEEWSLEGERLRALRREPAWLPSTGYEVDPVDGEPDLPQYDFLHVDADGLIWLAVAVRDPRWRAVPDPTERREVVGELYDVRIEVIDPDAGMVLASYRHDRPDQELPPFSRLFAGTRTSYRPVADTLGLNEIEIFHLHLVAR